jgi:hypothetical protein
MRAKYKFPTVNPKLTGKYGPTQLWAIQAYLDAFKDMGAIKVYEFYRTGRGGHTIHVELIFSDGAPKKTIKAGLIERYKAIPESVS